MFVWFFGWRAPVRSARAPPSFLPPPSSPPAASTVSLAGACCYCAAVAVAAAAIRNSWLFAHRPPSHGPIGCAR
eukprot:9397934-Pyramimonas_sp.AAC.1